MPCAVPGSCGPLTAEFETCLIGADGIEACASLVLLAEVRFEQVRPVRIFPAHKRQQHFPGLWWSSATGRHVGYESWLERDHLMLLNWTAFRLENEHAERGRSPAEPPRDTLVVIEPHRIVYTEHWLRRGGFAPPGSSGNAEGPELSPRSAHWIKKWPTRSGRADPERPHEPVPRLAIPPTAGQIRLDRTPVVQWVPLVEVPQLECAVIIDIGSELDRSLLRRTGTWRRCRKYAWGRARIADEWNLAAAAQPRLPGRALHRSGCPRVRHALPGPPDVGQHDGVGRLTVRGNLASS